MFVAYLDRHGMPKIEIGRLFLNVSDAAIYPALAKMMNRVPAQLPSDLPFSEWAEGRPAALTVIGRDALQDLLELLDTETGLPAVEGEVRAARVRVAQQLHAAKVAPTDIQVLLGLSRSAVTMLTRGQQRRQQQLRARLHEATLADLLREVQVRQAALDVPDGVTSAFRAAIDALTALVAACPGDGLLPGPADDTPDD
jgi:hypothetical protein